MNNKIKDLMPLFTFAAGAAIGATASWLLFKKKYEKIADEEINEMYRYYQDKLDELEDINEYDEEVYEFEEEVKQEAERIIEMAGYDTGVLVTSGPIPATQVIPEEEGEPETMEDRERPYVISPEEFDEIDGYNAISLTYYADEILADDQNNIIDDVDEIIGLDSLSHFGEYEDDSVFVRNDKLKSDYEILLDNKTFEEITAEVE